MRGFPHRSANVNQLRRRFAKYMKGLCNMIFTKTIKAKLIDCIEVGKSVKAMSQSKFLAKTILSVVLLAGSAVTSHAQYGQGVFWTHNGSWMTIYKTGRDITIEYQQPKKGLPIGPNTTLFYGTIRGNRISGTAHTFRQGCPEAPYRVSGRLRENGSVKSIVLNGAAPIRSGCRVTGYSKRSSNARLVFRYAGTGD